MNLMHDPDLPDAEEGVVENLIDTTTQKSAVVRMEFVPKGKGETVTKRKRFPTSAAAREYMTNALPPDPRTAIGSPKQAHARRARFLGLDPQWLASHNLICHLEMEYPDAIADGRTGRNASESDGPASGTEPAGGSLVHSGPPSADLLRHILAGESLPIEALELPESAGDEAENSGEEPESEAGLGADEEES